MYIRYCNMFNWQRFVCYFIDSVNERINHWTNNNSTATSRARHGYFSHPFPPKLHIISYVAALLRHRLSRSFSIFTSLVSSFQEWAYTMARRPSSVRPSVCKLLRKSLLLAGKWSDRYQTCTWWSPGKPASRVCSRSRSRSKVTWYAHFLGFLEWATPSLTVWF